MMLSYANRLIIYYYLFVIIRSNTKVVFAMIFRNVILGCLVMCDFYYNFLVNFIDGYVKLAARMNIYCVWKSPTINE